MSLPRVTLGVILLAAVVASGLWLRRHMATSQRGAPVGGGPATLGRPTVTATATPVPAPPGYRLAGVAVGEPASFVVVEAPDGTSGLYQRGAEIPGLGRLIRIEAERIVVQGGRGRFALWLAPAPTSTPVRHERYATPAVAPRTPTARPRSASPPARTVAESTPSAVRGRSVS